MRASAWFHIDLVDYFTHRTELEYVRHAVFVNEQHVPIELETDALDPLCQHMIAREHDGQVIGTARLSPDGVIGRMAVLPAWRGQQVGSALLEALLIHAKTQAISQVRLNAQVQARDFYARHGFLPTGDTFVEAGIAHQAMRRRLEGAMRIHDLAQTSAAVSAVIYRSRRQLCWRCHASDNALLGQTALLHTLRRFVTARGDRQVRLLLHDAGTHMLPPVLFALIQRLPGAFQVRQCLPGDNSPEPSSAISNDHSDSCLWEAGQGTLALNSPAVARQQNELFQQLWEHAKVCEELRVIGL